MLKVFLGIIIGTVFTIVFEALAVYLIIIRDRREL